MSSIARALCKGLRIETGKRVTALRDGPDGVELEFEDGSCQGPFARVISAVPAPQAADLLTAEPELVRRLADVVFTPVWTFMAVFSEKFDTLNRMSGPTFHRLFRQTIPGAAADGPGDRPF